LYAHGQVAPLFYSLIESAKLVGLDPHVYLRRATLAALSGETIPHQLVLRFILARTDV
jgi:hypothetical protein